MLSLRECENASSDRIISPQFIFVGGAFIGATSHLNEIQKLTSIFFVATKLENIA